MGKKAGKVALGLGLLTGAITGLLFAPDEGKNIRKKIVKGDAKGLLEDLENMGSEMKDMVSDIVKNPGVHDMLEKGKDMAADAVNMHREELDELLKKANAKADAFKKKVAAYVKEQKAMLEEKAKSAPKSKKSKAGKKKPAAEKKAPAKKTTKKAGKKKK